MGNKVVVVTASSGLVAVGMLGDDTISEDVLSCVLELVCAGADDRVTCN